MARAAIKTPAKKTPEAAAKPAVAAPAVRRGAAVVPASQTAGPVTTDPVEGAVAQRELEVETAADPIASELPEGLTNDTAPEHPLTSYDILLSAAQAHNPTFEGPGAKEGEQVFYMRLVHQIGEIDEASWNSLPTDTAQSWYNGACDAMQEGKPISALEGYASRPQAPPKRTAAPKPKAPATTAPKAPRTIVRESRGPNTQSVTYRIREISMNNLAMPWNELKALLEKEIPGVKPGTLTTIRADMLAVIAVAKATGHWKD